MKQKLKCLFMFMAVVILTTANNAYALVDPKQNITSWYKQIGNSSTIPNPLYITFKNYFLILAFIILVITMTIYFIKNKTNGRRIRNIIIISIIGIILSISLYYLGSNTIPEYYNKTEYVNIPTHNIGTLCSGSELISLINDIAPTNVGIIVKTEDYVDDYTGMTYEEKLEGSPDIVSTGRYINPYVTCVVTAVNKKPNGEVDSIEFSFTR